MLCGVLVVVISLAMLDVLDCWLLDFVLLVVVGLWFGWFMGLVMWVSCVDFWISASGYGCGDCLCLGLLFVLFLVVFGFAGVGFLAVGFEFRCLWVTAAGCYMFYCLGLVAI